VTRSEFRLQAGKKLSQDTECHCEERNDIVRLTLSLIEAPGFPSTTPPLPQIFFVIYEFFRGFITNSFVDCRYWGGTNATDFWRSAMARKKATGPTDRELAILGVLWDKGAATVREVHEALHADSETGYTTTLKLMQIMVEKGLLVREDESRPHVYRPALSEEKTQRQLVADLLDRVFAGSAEKLVLRALSAKKVSPKELKRIREMLDEMEGA
jgi:BlaI family penicillinase repressor